MRMCRKNEQRRQGPGDAHDLSNQVYVVANVDSHSSHKYKVAGLFDPRGPAAMARAKRSCSRCFGSNDHAFAPRFREITGEVVDFRIVHERQNRVCASEIVDFQMINERQNRACAAGLVDFQIGSETQNRVSASEIVDFQKK